MLTRYSLPSVDHHERCSCVPDERPRLDLWDRSALAFLVRADCLLLQDMVVPELLADLTERDAETKRGNDVECAELQAEPAEGRHWLENEAVDFDDRSEKESHFRRVGVSETVRKSVVDAFLSLVGITLALLAE